jgi:tRNA (guanosine-2'-O-)-methyltransferase
VAFCGCGRPAPPKAPPASSNGIVLRAGPVATEGVAGAGPERCFNAKDDNQNGLIDEGCGVRTGIVQFTIAWDAPTADVDLLVTDPKGELVEVGRPTSLGLAKERDCPGKRAECHGQNFENVYLERDEAKRGRYRVKIRLERLMDEDVPIRVTLGVRLGPKTYSGEVLLNRPEAEQEITFDL